MVAKLRRICTLEKVISLAYGHNKSYDAKIREGQRWEQRTLEWLRTAVLHVQEVSKQPTINNSGESRFL